MQLAQLMSKLPAAMGQTAKSPTVLDMIDVNQTHLCSSYYRPILADQSITDIGNINQGNVGKVGGEEGW